MNLSEEKRRPLLMCNMDNRRKLLEQHYKQKFAQSRSKFVSPSEYVAYLQQHSTDGYTEKLYNCIKSLRIELTNKPLTWVKEFGHNSGLACILSILDNCYDREVLSRSRQELQLECIKCIKALMNNTVLFEFT